MKKLRSVEEIEAKIAEIKSDERMSYPAATVFANAPLALIQTGMENQLAILKWVLGED